MSTELVQSQGTSLARRDELGVEEVIAQVQKIQLVMEKVMTEGEHYGVIPGTNKPTLLKPGAEKLLLTFRFDPQYESHETYDGKHLTVKSRCTLYHISSGLRMGSGEGSCSTKESKYAYRHAKRKCPQCSVEQINRSKFPPKGGGEPGWYCHAKGGGCGAQFAANDVAIMSQTTGRVPNEDLADQYNTVLKMANKRSLVAAVLNVTAASDIFTQDLEDTHEPTREPDRRTAVAREASPGDPTRPMTDPDTPEAKTEASALFPTPEDDERRTLIAEIQAAGAKLTKVQRGRIKEMFCGSAEANLEHADLAALEAILKHLREMK